MGESRSHIDLVSIAYNCALSLVPQEFKELVQADNADFMKPSRIIGNFVPDVFFWNQDLLIIGEAKTISDFDRPHSLAQYDAYMQECGSFSGKAILIISVPWQLILSAKNYFRRVKKKFDYKFQIIIINEIDGRLEI